MNNNIKRIQFTNAQCSLLNGRIDLFVACIGYEERSCYIYKKIKSKLDSSSLLLLSVNDYERFPHSKDLIDEERERNVECCIVPYNDAESVQERIVKRVQKVISCCDDARIHIDYSSMPRNWYCKLPELLNPYLTQNSIVYFWYSEGVYPLFDDEYPTAGIKSYVLYSGKPSLLDRKCTHFIGVGYDSIRTRGIITLLNPESVITCAANNPERSDVIKRVEAVNKEIMNESYMNLSLNITDIEYMIAKLKGIVNEVFTIAQSDIVMVPDGPKPLIFVMSMIPWLTGKTGICCLHIVRNDSIFKPYNIIARGQNDCSTFSDEDHIIGFSISSPV